jgi:hypothetical protein
VFRNYLYIQKYLAAGVKCILLLWVLSSCEKEEKAPLIPQVGTMMIPMRDTLPPVIAENTLLTNTHPWYIAGWVYVSNEATLTIEPGTVIKITGREDTGAGLVVTRGARIMARGLQDWPILFQLNNAFRSWSGIVLLGKAPQKKMSPQTENVISNRYNSGWAYGGVQPDDSSGVLAHVRILTKPCKHDVEGKQLQHGLLLLGAGRKTVVKDVVTDTSSSAYGITAASLK